MQKRPSSSDSCQAFFCVVQHRQRLLACHTRKPLQKITNAGAFLQVFEQRPDWHSRALEYPGPADALRISLYCWQVFQSSMPNHKPAIYGKQGSKAKLVTAHAQIQLGATEIMDYIPLTNRNIYENKFRPGFSSAGRSDRLCRAGVD